MAESLHEFFFEDVDVNMCQPDMNKMLDYPFNLKSVFCVVIASKMSKCNIFLDIRTLKKRGKK